MQIKSGIEVLIHDSTFSWINVFFNPFEMAGDSWIYSCLIDGGAALAPANYSNQNSSPVLPCEHRTSRVTFTTVFTTWKISRVLHVSDTFHVSPTPLFFLFVFHRWSVFLKTSCVQLSINDRHGYLPLGSPAQLDLGDRLHCLAHLLTKGIVECGQLHLLKDSCSLTLLCEALLLTPTPILRASRAFFVFLHLIKILSKILYLRLFVQRKIRLFNLGLSRNDLASVISFLDAPYTNIG